MESKTGNLAVVVLQQGFPTQLSAKKRVHRMLGFHVWRVYVKIAVRIQGVAAGEASVTATQKTDKKTRQLFKLFLARYLHLHCFFSTYASK